MVRLNHITREFPRIFDFVTYFTSCEDLGIKEIESAAHMVSMDCMLYFYFRQPLLFSAPKTGIVWGDFPKIW